MALEGSNPLRRVFSIFTFGTIFVNVQAQTKLGHGQVKVDKDDKEVGQPWMDGWAVWDCVDILPYIDMKIYYPNLSNICYTYGDLLSNYV